jgi:Mrp family chromosome partitioning ATPase
VDATVCAVDANLGSPTLHRLFHHDNLNGLSEAISESKPASIFVKRVEESNLYFLPAGSKDANRSSTGADLAKRLGELRNDFDYLILQGPPLGARAIAGVRSACDGVVLVVDSSGISLDWIARIRKHLRSTQMPLFGVVLSERASPSSSVLGRLIS